MQQCEICDLANVVAINRDLIYRRSMREVLGRNKLNEQIPQLNPDELQNVLMIHLRDHITKPTQALTNHMLQKQAVELKNTVIEANTTIDQIDMFSLEVLNRLDKGIEDDSDFAKVAKVYSDLLKRRLDATAILHKISGKEKGNEAKGAMMESYFKQIGQALGQKRVSEIKKEGQINKKKKKKSRVEFVLDELVEDFEVMEEVSDDKIHEEDD